MIFLSNFSKKLKNNFINNSKSLTIMCSILFFYLILYLSFSSFQIVEGHFDHLGHYNTAGFGISDKYYVNQQIDPEYTKPNELSQIMFSIQDTNGRDVRNIVVMVEIYSSITGERISVFPWTKLDTGDFSDPFIFPKRGNYQIVLSVLNGDIGTSQIINTVPSPRTILNDNSGCNCERGVFNASVTENFGSIFITVIFISVFGAVFVLGVVLFWMYWSRRKHKSLTPVSNNDFIKYSVLFLAFGASIVHLAVYPEHAALRLEYSIFLISASAAQLTYGIMYILLIFSEDPVAGNIKKSDEMLVSKQYYKKSLILNLFGLLGSLVLILLYIYAITFPPPLSPNSHPEDVDIAGILDKLLEVVLVIGILFLMRYERKRYMYSFRTSNFKNI
jgi:hypothetical protein